MVSLMVLTREKRVYLKAWKEINLKYFKNIFEKDIKWKSNYLLNNSLKIIIIFRLFLLFKKPEDDFHRTVETCCLLND